LRLEFTMPDGCSQAPRTFNPFPSHPPLAAQRCITRHSPAQVPIRRARALRRQREPPAQGAGCCTRRHRLCRRRRCRRRQRSSLLQPRAMRSIVVGADAVALFISSSARGCFQSRRGIVPRALPRRPCRGSAARKQRRQLRGDPAGPVEAGQEIHAQYMVCFPFTLSLSHPTLLSYNSVPSLILIPPPPFPLSYASSSVLQAELYDLQARSRAACITVRSSHAAGQTLGRVCTHPRAAR